jgi:hypothetical protein
MTLDQKTPPKPLDRRSWSSKDARARDDCVLRNRWRDPRPSWPPPPLSTPTAPRATVVTTGPGVRRCRSSASGAPSPLARPCMERRRRSFLVERRRRSPASGRHRHWPPGSSPLARPREPPPPIAHMREPPPPLKPNPSRRGGVFIAA